ncbi:cytochrome c maturation protein CcmE [Aquabacterium sp. OR-4]|uniref:cytochrome c maturation protein CcmE n=1 Tax=Aquabacterium sp. OR-4 TaxID=2978127 RepID=UPI0028C89216|nr:cytochrome c maturation protein CcmE [Aquabacterium sp. OR-4]MDT7838710.1 cytochrome c maturation protein CcmE [Aquabacterium sp. OR-4]
MKPRHRRLLLGLAVLGLLGVAGTLAARALRSNLVFFVTPAQVLAGEAAGREQLRLGGMVQAGSIRRGADGMQVQFVIADRRHAVPVLYRGVLPDLFAEGQGAVAQGRLQPDGSLLASEVLAKHDENYRPPGVEMPPQATAAAPLGARP